MSTLLRSLFGLHPVQLVDVLGRNITQVLAKNEQYPSAEETPGTFKANAILLLFLSFPGVSWALRLSRLQIKSVFVTRGKLAEEGWTNIWIGWDRQSIDADFGRSCESVESWECVNFGDKPDFNYQYFFCEGIISQTHFVSWKMRAFHSREDFTLFCFCAVINLMMSFHILLPCLFNSAS